ncbi:DUF2752 domain-containing protein [Flavobacterium sp. J49]|uniref:DUF2752 domain-containing protein n=1 Tax=Flavobacterium sp. J49 TaxID=2718534 RepID=UPI001593907E|nr:DUF2752 domain-containing protein [Flavobacterium sp. J49]MBF6641617.1 DUF2752 domain-containing protein [Flavobacterium sp. J49]NIC02864.1 DUF2752 domain-containing protein [Flavobacterium sp. J49]
MTRNKLYSLLLIAFLAGFIYLFYSIQKEQQETVGVCIIKNVTGYACPSCGTTRAVLLLFEGKITDSLLLNPFGIIVAIIMTVFPIWVLTDIVLKKETFFKAYKKTESIIRKPWLAIGLVLLVLLNWIWNLYKNL